MRLSNLSVSDRKLIKEAMRIIDSGGHDASFRKNGWRGPFKGVYKKAFIKGNIVVKNGPSVQLEEELKLWNKTYRYKSYRRFRKHLARVFGIYKGRMFQRFISDNGEYCSDENKCERIAYSIGICDWGCHNHRHAADGRPIWFDTNTYG